MGVMQIEPWVRCTQCNAPLPIREQYIDFYLSGQKLTCPECSESLDWWSVVLHEIRDNFMFNQAFAPIGARSTIFKVTLKPGELTHYKFSDHGIPSNAKVLYVNYAPYTPGGSGLFPLEFHGNIPTRRLIGDKVTIFPMPLGDGAANVETEVSVCATWIPHTADDNAWLSLVDAFEAYTADRYEAAIVPANVAVESTLSRFLAEYMTQYSSRKRIDDFLANAATYSYQLNIIIPLVVSLAGFAKLPDDIRGQLNRLRDLRNQISHHGATDKPLTKEDVAEVLCAALFGFRYVRLIEAEYYGRTTMESS